MRNLISALAIWLIVAPLAMAAAGKLQNADFATSAQITLAGGSVSQLLNSSKMFNSVDSEIMDTSIARWNAKLSSPVNLATQVTGILPFANGGTNASSAAAAFANLSPLTTKGDLLGFSTLNARVPVGTDGQVLTADSTQALGVKYATPAAGTVTSVSVVSANGLAGTVATATTTPAITLSTTITGVLKGNGTAISAAVSGTDYQAPISNFAAATHQFVNSWTAPNTFGSAQPAFTDISGNITNAQLPTYTNHGVLLGTGAAGIGATGAGTAGQVLTSNGAGADPTFQAAGGSSSGSQVAWTLEGAIVPFISINGSRFAPGAQILSTVNLTCLNSGSSGSNVFQVNQYRSGSLQGSATASLAASSGNTASSAASLSGSLSLVAGDVITVDVNSVAGGTPSDCSLEFPTAGSAVISSLQVSSKSGNYTVTNSDDVILLSGSTNFTITMQAISSSTVKPYKFQVTGGATITFFPNGSDAFFVNGASETSFTMNGSGMSIELIPNTGDSKWYAF